MFSSGLLTNLEFGQDTLFLVVVSQSTKMYLNEKRTCGACSTCRNRYFCSLDVKISPTQSTDDMLELLLVSLLFVSSEGMRKAIT